MLIINADDFGLNEQVNFAVIESFKKGFCSSTTLMPNMPAFSQACQLIHEKKLLGQVGIHLVLKGGMPLSEKIKHCPKFCNANGELIFNPNSFFLNLESAEKSALAEEIRAQIKRCREFGVPLTHLDSHHSLHAIWQIASIVIPIIKEESIPFMRIKSNADLYALPFRFKLYTQAYNYRLRILKLARTKFMGSVRYYRALKQRLNAVEPISFEICIHPLLSNTGELTDVFFEQSLDLEREIKQIDGYENCVSYSGRKYLD